MARRAAQPRFPGRRARWRPGRAIAIAASVAVLVGVPVLVVVLASGQHAQATSAQERVVPGSSDPRRPSVPFFANAGDGVRPDGVGCSSTPGTAVRARTHLDVFADASPVTVPAGVGVLASCAYWLRTEAADGIIVIGSPERRDFTLGDFFDVWGAPLGRGRALGFRVSAGRPLRAFVDGRPAAGDPRAIRLADGREIALVIGRLPPTVPARFAFPRAR
jgi:hypothetical protein